jgi:hypothetical protein
MTDEEAEILGMKRLEALNRKRSVTIHLSKEAEGNPAAIDAGIAKTLTRPTVNAARSVFELTAVNVGGNDARPSADALVAELDAQVKLVQAGNLDRAEEMLFAQAHTLDAIFSDLVRQAVPKIRDSLETADAFMRLAFKAQSQCRATLETLALVKNPPNVAFVKQANIANGPQQINNGVFPPHAAENLIERSKLLRRMDESRLDTGATREAIPANKALATLEPIHRPAHNGRKGASLEKRRQGQRARPYAVAPARP